MQKIIKDFARGQMALMVLSPENVGQIVTKLVDIIEMLGEGWSFTEDQ